MTADVGRDYLQEIMACAQLRRDDFSFSELSFTADFSGSTDQEAKAEADFEMESEQVDEQLKGLRFQQDTLALKKDETAAIRYWAQRSKRDRSAHLLQVAHITEMNTLGTTLAKNHIQKTTPIKLVSTLGDAVPQVCQAGP